MRDAYDKFAPPERGRFGDNEYRRDVVRGNDSVRSDLKDFVLHLRVEREKAIGVAQDDTPDAKLIWLPKSQIEFEKKPGGLVRVTMPEWLAIEKGLL
jgi:hypothetical protein